MLTNVTKYMCSALFVLSMSVTGAQAEWKVQENEVRDEYFEGKHIKSVVNDASGSIWVLDGQMNLYRSDESGWTEVSDNEGQSIQSLFVYLDRIDSVWCASPDLMKYDNDLHEWRTVLRSGEDYQGRVKCMAVGMNDELWAGISGEGLLHYNGEKVELLTSDDGLSSYIINAIGIDSSNNVWIVTDAPGIARYDREEKRVTTIYAESINVVVTAMIIDKLDRVWLGHDTGVIVIDGNEHVFLDWRNGFPGLHVTDIHLEENQKIWIACGTLAGYHQTGYECGTGTLISIDSLYPPEWEVYPFRFDALYSVAVVPGEQILLCGSYCGLVRFDLDNTSNAVTGTRPLPHASILGVYPNPFNFRVKIGIDVGSGSVRNLDIYNITGQKIRNISSGWESAGTHYYFWDGCDDNGLRASTGLYYVRLTTRYGSCYKKVLYMK